MATDPTLSYPQFVPWTDEERRQHALKIVEQLRANRRLNEELKDGKARLEKLLVEWAAGGEVRDVAEAQTDLEEFIEEKGGKLKPVQRGGPTSAA